MTKLTRFFATCLLVLSISAVGFADGVGGILQSPPAPVSPPSAQNSLDYSITDASSAAQPATDWTVDIVTEVEVFAASLTMSLL